MKYLLPSLVVFILLILTIFFILKIFFNSSNKQSISEIKVNNCNDALPSFKVEIKSESNRISSITTNLGEILTSLYNYNKDHVLVSEDSTLSTKLLLRSSDYQKLIAKQIDAFNNNLGDLNCNYPNLLSEIKTLKKSFDQIIVDYQVFYLNSFKIVDLTFISPSQNEASQSSQIQQKINAIVQQQ